MGLFRTLRKNEGASVETDMGTVEIIVRYIGGRRSNRSASFEVRGFEGRNYLYLESESGLFYFRENFAVGIRDNVSNSGSQVAMHFRTKFPIVFQNYP